MTMKEFAQMVQDVHNARTITKGSDYSLSPKEQAYKVFRRSLFAVKDIEVGEEITEQSIRSIRPGYGVEPKNLKVMVGKKQQLLSSVESRLLGRSLRISPER